MTSTEGRMTACDPREVMPMFPESPGTTTRAAVPTVTPGGGGSCLNHPGAAPTYSTTADVTAPAAARNHAQEVRHPQRRSNPRDSGHARVADNRASRRTIPQRRAGAQERRREVARPLLRAPCGELLRVALEPEGGRRRQPRPVPVPSFDVRGHAVRGPAYLRPVVERAGGSVACPSRRGLVAVDVQAVVTRAAA